MGYSATCICSTGKTPPRIRAALCSPTVICKAPRWLGWRRSSGSSRTEADCYVNVGVASGDLAQGEHSAVEKREIDLRLAVRNEIRNRLSGSAAHRPAQRAMTGIEIQVWIACAADKRNIRWRRRPQPAPVLWVFGIDGVAKPFVRASGQCFATHRIELEVIAGQLRGPRHPETIAEPRKNHFLGVIGDAHGWRRRRIDDPKCR